MQFLQIAELGLDILKRLSSLAEQINSDLANFESRVKSKNALISWRELVSLVKEYTKYSDAYWEEFTFDIKQVLQGSNLEPQVVAAHEYALSQSKRRQEVKSKAKGLDLSSGVKTQYQNLKSRLDRASDQLIDYKFEEEREGSVSAAVQKFRDNLAVANKVAVLKDVYKLHQINPHVFEKWFETRLKDKIFGEEKSSDVLMELFAIHRSIVEEYVQDPRSLSEWCYTNESFQQVYSCIGVGNSAGLVFLPLALKEGVSHPELVGRIRQELLSIIQIAFDETFEWLMTQ